MIGATRGAAGPGKRRVVSVIRVWADNMSRRGVPAGRKALKNAGGEVA